MFDSGLLRICELSQVAVNGGMPVETLTETGKAFYGNRNISAARMYQAFGADRQIDKLVRVPFDTEVEPENYVVFENGEQFRIDSVTEVFPYSTTGSMQSAYNSRAIELTLVKLGENYNVVFAE